MRDVLPEFRSAVMDLRAGSSLCDLARLELAVAGRLAQRMGLAPGGSPGQPGIAQEDPHVEPSAGAATQQGSSGGSSGGWQAEGVGLEDPAAAADVYNHLGLGGSLLSALAQAGAEDSELLAAVAGRPDGPIMAPLDEVRHSGCLTVLLYTGHSYVALGLSKLEPCSPTLSTGTRCMWYRNIVLSATARQVLELAAAALRSWQLSSPGLTASADPSPGDGPTPEQQQQTNASSPAASVAAMLCTHYRVPRVECLGHGPVGRLLRRVSELQVAPRPGWHAAAALAPPQPLQAGTVSSSGTGPWGLGGGTQAEAGGGGDNAAAGALGAVDRGAALAALRAAPVLCDLGLATQWGAVFEPELGPLGAFLREEAAAAGGMQGLQFKGES